MLNVGKQTARGIEAEIGLRPWHGFSPYASAQYLDARAKSDYPLRGDFLPTTGKRAVLSPEIVAAAGLTFDDGHFFANIDVNYSGEQFSTFMNDEVLPAYTVANAGIGYRFDRIGPARHGGRKSSCPSPTSPTINICRAFAAYSPMPWPPPDATAP